jgi:hypothetical protein
MISSRGMSRLWRWLNHLTVPVYLAIIPQLALELASRRHASWRSSCPMARLSSRSRSTSTRSSTVLSGGFDRWSDSKEPGAFSEIVRWHSRSLPQRKPMSHLLRSLFELSAVPLRFGVIAADAALSLGRSIAGSETASKEQMSRFSDAEIEAAARVIEVSLVTGRDIASQNMLQTNFPEGTIRAMAEAALTAARNARLEAASSSRPYDFAQWPGEVAPLRRR